MFEEFQVLPCHFVSITKCQSPTEVASLINACSIINICMQKLINKNTKQIKMITCHLFSFPIYMYYLESSAGTKLQNKSSSFDSYICGIKYLQFQTHIYMTVRYQILSHGGSQQFFWPKSGPLQINILHARLASVSSYYTTISTYDQIWCFHWFP